MKDVNVAVSKKADAAVTAEPAKTPVLSIVKNGPLFGPVIEFNRADLLASGATEAELGQKQERMVPFDAVTGQLVFGKNVKGRIRDVLIEGEILGASTFVSKELDYKILVIHATSRTYFTLMPGQKQFGFYIAGATTNAKEAVVGLLVNNLARGKETFHKSADRLYPKARFFWELIRSVCGKEEVIELQLSSGERNDTTKVPAKLFFYSDDVSKTVLSIGGFCHDFDFATYPEYYQDAFKRAKAGQGKLNHKITGLIMDKAAQFKPAQKKRSEKAVVVSEEDRKKNTENLQRTLQSVRERAHELGQEKPSKAKAAKVKEQAPKDGKKKKK